MPELHATEHSLLRGLWKSASAYFFCVGSLQFYAPGSPLFTHNFQEVSCGHWRFKLALAQG